MFEGPVSFLCGVPGKLLYGTLLVRDFLPASPRTGDERLCILMYQGLNNSKMFVNPTYFKKHLQKEQEKITVRFQQDRRYIIFNSILLPKLFKMVQFPA